MRGLVQPGLEASSVKLVRNVADHDGGTDIDAIHDVPEQYHLRLIVDILGTTSINDVPVDSVEKHASNVAVRTLVLNVGAASVAVLGGSIGSGSIAIVAVHVVTSAFEGLESILMAATVQIVLFKSATRAGLDLLWLRATNVTIAWVESEQGRVGVVLSVFGMKGADRCHNVIVLSQVSKTANTSRNGNNSHRTRCLHAHRLLGKPTQHGQGRNTRHGSEVS